MRALQIVIFYGNCPNATDTFPEPGPELLLFPRVTHGASCNYFNCLSNSYCSQ